MVPKSALPRGLWRGRMHLKLYMVITGIVIINWSLKSLKGHQNAVLVPGGAHPGGQAAGTPGGHFKTGRPLLGMGLKTCRVRSLPRSLPLHWAPAPLSLGLCGCGLQCTLALSRWPHARTLSEASAKPASSSRHPGWGVWHGQRRGLWEGSGCSRGSF